MRSFHLNHTASWNVGVKSKQYYSKCPHYTPWLQSSREFRRGNQMIGKSHSCLQDTGKNISSVSKKCQMYDNTINFFQEINYMVFPYALLTDMGIIKWSNSQSSFYSGCYKINLFSVENDWLFVWRGQICWRKSENVMPKKSSNSLHIIESS